MSQIVTIGAGSPSVLTELQRRALTYLKDHRGEGFIESSTIARHYGLGPRVMRGSMWHLHRRGLIDKA